MSLSLLYHVASPATSFRINDFVLDGSSVVDVIAAGMQIWNPASLVRKNIKENQSISDNALYLAATEGGYVKYWKSMNPAPCAHPTLRVVLTG